MSHLVNLRPFREVEKQNFEGRESKCKVLLRRRRRRQLQLCRSIFFSPPPPPPPFEVASRQWIPRTSLIFIFSSDPRPGVLEGKKPRKTQTHTCTHSLTLLLIAKFEVPLLSLSPPLTSDESAARRASRRALQCTANGAELP